MPTQEERLTNLEKAVAFLQEQSSAVDIRGLNRDVTMAFGRLSRQDLDIQEMKTSLARVEESMKSLGQTLTIILDAQDKRFSTLESHLEAQDKKFDRLESLLSQVLARLPEKP